ncbi:potassium transporter Kup [Lacipirellula limnantheis]|uniref:Probable potassium transport system protein Kup n=1 Tax=Lacipirellula limnantheis TaxID=2528024 RepID=A0A517TTB3_9BACT|nr:potassium transporter Kup [Lacipirellula limnantheis]QDT71615.1 potassium transport protein Kup [Lacipirellula limnantheis]
MTQALNAMSHPLGQLEAVRGDAPSRETSATTKALALAALGIVYGDIGTSPLYALQSCFVGDHSVGVTPLNVLGVLSLIFWALTLVVSVKYLVFIMRADNHGEGGILALTALLSPLESSGAKRRIVVTLGLFGAAFLYADGMITPAISVLSAVEGLRLAAPTLPRYWIIAISMAILLGLFKLQSRGTARVGGLFGPIMLAWFATLAGLGAWHISHEPQVLAALNPAHALAFFRTDGASGFLILGTVFLAVTGGEALYADMGHFGPKPIRMSWFAVVFPALLLNYFGQGALLLKNPAASANPLFEMAPEWALYPMILLATAAAVIASQAIITGSFSLTFQAIQLGFCPRLRIEHTSAEQRGQIYIPAVNRTLMLATMALVLGFRTSNNLAAAYGIAISMTMTTTTLLFFLLIAFHWKWSPWIAGAFVLCFLPIDLSFLTANLAKVFHGGWFPLLIAAGIYLLMSTWQRGRQLLARRMQASVVPTEAYVEELAKRPLLRPAGTAVYLTSNPQGTPLALRQNVIHNDVLHERVIIVGVKTVETPRAPASERLHVEQVAPGVYRAILHYGFMERPNVPRDLAGADFGGEPLDPQQTSFFLGRETVLPTKGAGMWLWRERMFAYLVRNSHAATVYFQLPPDRVVEVGVQLAL